MKKSKYLFFEKKEDLRLFLVAKSEKTYKKYFSHKPVLVRNGFLNRGPFAEVESIIRPLPLVQLIKSAVAPLLESPAEATFAFLSNIFLNLI